jgi:hypothetical protein
MARRNSSRNTLGKRLVVRIVGPSPVAGGDDFEVRQFRWLLRFFIRIQLPTVLVIAALAAVEYHSWAAATAMLLVWVGGAPYVAHRLRRAKRAATTTYSPFG